MKYTFRKYEFTNAEAATKAVAALGVDEETNTPTHRHTIAMLGHIVTKAATYDKEGKQLKAAVLAKKYSVDVLWRDGVVADWKANIVWPDPVGVHSFGNSEANAEYTATLVRIISRPRARD